jgi:predicted nuclease of predicted toxin-antitoxin system
MVKRSDKDFGELVYRQGRVHTGVILARLAGLSSNQKAEIMSAALATCGAELVGSFSVVSPGRFAFVDPVLRRRV